MFSLELPYATFASYHSSDFSEVGKRAKFFVDQIKRPNEATLKKALGYVHRHGVLKDFLNQNQVLVPVPGHAKRKADSAWPSIYIANTAVSLELGKNVLPCIRRHTAIRKSSLIRLADDRPTVDEHMQTLKIDAELESPSRITLVDDVMTLGRTSFACALLLHQRWPEADIRFFAMFRHQLSGYVIPKDIMDIKKGIATRNPDSGKVRT